MKSIYFLILAAGYFACSATTDKDSTPTIVSKVNRSIENQEQTKSSGDEIHTNGPEELIPKDVENERITIRQVQDKSDQETTRRTDPQSVIPNENRESPGMQAETIFQTKQGEEVQQKTSRVELVTTETDIHEQWDQILTQHVSEDGWVDYSALRSKKGIIEDYLTELAQLPPESLTSQSAQLAYYINLYNAATVNLILDNFPLNSIMDLDGGKTWDVKRVLIEDELHSLNEIEHDIIRPKFKDARIHFAVNCAAKSCPPLANRAYNKDNVYALMQSQGENFINNTRYNHLAEDHVKLSKIFEWYRADFTPDLISFINGFSEVSVESDASIEFAQYDWALNGK